MENTLLVNVFFGSFLDETPGGTFGERFGTASGEHLVKRANVFTGG